MGHRESEAHSILEHTIIKCNVMHVQNSHSTKAIETSDVRYPLYLRARPMQLGAIPVLHLPFSSFPEKRYSNNVGVGLTKEVTMYSDPRPSKT